MSTLLQLGPHFTLRCKGFGRVACHLIEKERQNAVAPDVFGDILLRVVSSHLSTVVDVLLKDVAQHIGVDVLARCRYARVEVPTPLVEEVEEALKGSVVDVDVLVVAFYLMLVEHAPIEVGNLAINQFKLSLMAGCIESVLEELNEEALVERLEELIIASLLLTPCQLVSQIIDIAIEKTLLLNEIAKHQSVEHHRGIPLLIAIGF